MFIPENISAASLPLLIMGGLLLWSGIFFTGFSTYLPKGNVDTRDYLCFGLTSLAAAMFSFSGAAAFSLPELPGVYFWSAAQFFFSIPLVIFFILFSAHHLHLNHFYFTRIFPLLSAAFLPLFLKPRLMLRYEVISNPFHFFGFSFVQPRVPLAPLGAVFIIWAFFNAALIGIFWLKYLRTRRGEWSLMAGFFLFVAAGSYDALVSFNFFHGPNLFVYGFGCLLAGMAWQLFHNVNRANQKYREKTLELERAHEEIQFLVSTISHDVLSPLISIHGFVDLLEDQLGKDVAENKNYLQRIRVNADHMKALLNDLVAYLKMGQVEEERMPIQWEPLIQEVLAMLDVPHHWPEGKVEVTGEWPSIQASSKRLKQLLMNLLQNALKYAGRPDVRVRVSGQAQGQGILLRVEDNGPGIPEKLRDKVFQAFFRNHPETPGTGMGLAIVKKIAEGHRGRVWIDPGCSSGTAVLVYLEP